jgi:hypothetical protein
MAKQIKLFLPWVLVFSGLISFVLQINGITPVLLAAILYCMLIMALPIFSRRFDWLAALPFASGLLCFFCRLFYWDRLDWTRRAENLLLLSFLFSLLILIYRLKLARRFLLFFNHLRLRRRLLILFVFSEFIFVVASHIIVQKNVGLVGDEAHYLVIAQSIARDGDLNVFNQYARGQYREFSDHHLQSHAKIGKGFKHWYSFHLPGLSLTLAPLFFLKLSPPLLIFLIRSYLGLFAALLVLLVYLFVLRIWRNRSLALWAAMVFSMTSPIFFMSIHIFAEIQALLLILSSLYLLFFFQKRSGWPDLLSGLLLGLTVFWGMKYMIFIYLLGIGVIIHFINKRKARRALLFIIFPLIFQLFFSYLYLAYGNFSPMSIYTGVMSESQARTYYENVREISFKSRAETLLDYFFDQRDGLLPYNPFYFFFFPGLFLAIKKIKVYLPLLLVSLAGFVYLFYHAFSTVRPGVCPQARYMVPIMWMLMAFCLVYYRETGNRFFRKIFLAVPFYSFFVIAYQLFNPLTLYQSTTHDQLFRPGLMFQQWSNIHINLPALLPSYIKTVPSLLPPFYRSSQNWAYFPNILMLAVFMILVAVALIRTRRSNLKFVPYLSFAGFFVLFVLFPRPPLFNPILINKPGVIPYLIHGQGFQPAKMAEKKFVLGPEKNHPVLISTRSPAPFMLIQIENPGKTVNSALISLFDRTEGEVQIVPSEKKRVIIDHPEFKKLGSRFYYQFMLQMKGEFLSADSMVVEFYPLKKKRR